MGFTERGIDMLELKKNSAELFPAKWYKAGVVDVLNDPAQRTKLKGPAFKEFYVEILGACNQHKNQTAQNLIVNTSGTVVRTSAHLDLQQDDQIEFMGMMWYIEEVEYDLSGISPQAGVYGDIFKNAVTTLKIVALKRKNRGVR